MRHNVAVEQSFPLTLTLSPGEREHPPRDVRSAQPGSAKSVSGWSKDSGRRLPLPWGEGRLPAATAAAQAGG